MLSWVEHEKFYNFGAWLVIKTFYSYKIYWKKIHVYTCNIRWGSEWKHIAYRIHFLVQNIVHFKDMTYIAAADWPVSLTPNLNILVASVDFTNRDTYKCNAILRPSFENVFGLLQCRPNQLDWKVEKKCQKVLVATKMLLRTVQVQTKIFIKNSRVWANSVCHLTLRDGIQSVERGRNKRDDSREKHCYPRPPLRPTLNASTEGPCPTIIQKSRTPRHRKLPSTINCPTTHN